MQKILNLTYASSLTRLCEINSSFDSGILRIAYYGKNRNGSYIDKSTFEKCLKTIYNCPVVCNYNIETDTIGGHDVDLVRDNNGELHLINVTTPVGCIPESAKTFWETVTEDDGTIHEYLCAETLIWKRQSAYQKIKQDGCVAQSMEITVKDGEMTDGVYVIKDFEFTAFALIGVEPCFESAALEFSHKDFKLQMQEMMLELKECFSNIASKNEDNDIHPQHFSTEGGDKTLEDKLNLIASYNLKAEDLDFQIDELTMEELETKLKEFTKDDGQTGKKDEPEGDDKNGGKEEFGLEGQFREELYKAVAAIEKIECEFGEYPRYHVSDYDKDLNEVYVWDETDWLLYGMSYEINGDAVVVNPETKKRKKYIIADFDEGETQASPFNEVYSTLKKYASDKSATAAKYEQAQNEINELTKQVNELSEFKKNVESEAVTKQKNELLDKFSDLSGIEEFELLKGSIGGMEIPDIEEKCFAIRGKNIASLNFAANAATRANTRLAIDKANNEALSDKEPYGGIVIKYSK